MDTRSHTSLKTYKDQFTVAGFKGMSKKDFTEKFPILAEESVSKADKNCTYVIFYVQVSNISKGKFQYYIEPNHHQCIVKSLKNPPKTKDPETDFKSVARKIIEAIKSEKLLDRTPHAYADEHIEVLEAIVEKGVYDIAQLISPYTNMSLLNAWMSRREELKMYQILQAKNERGKYKLYKT